MKIECNLSRSWNYNVTKLETRRHYWIWCQYILFCGILRLVFERWTLKTCGGILVKIDEPCSHTVQNLSQVTGVDIKKSQFLIFTLQVHIIEKL
jgi:hypothetical protein